MQNHVVIAPDKFRGSATGTEVAAALAAGLRSAGVTLPIVEMPIADGGEGTIEAFVGAGFTAHTARVSGPLGETLSAQYAVRGDVAIIESAQCCGLESNSPSAQQSLRATSYGLGELILIALDGGAKKLIVGVGGTASTDGGEGMLRALAGEALSPLLHGDSLWETPFNVDAVAALNSLFVDIEVVVAADVDNVLCGPEGAAHVFGPQKGAGVTEIDVLEKRLSEFSLAIDPNGAVAGSAGSGAGGGIAFGLIAVADGVRVPGAALILDMLGLDAAIQGASLVITGEGKLDLSSLGGKGAVAVAQRAGRLGVPVAAVVGVNELQSAAWKAAGFASLNEVRTLADSNEDSQQRALEFLRQIGSQITIPSRNSDRFRQ